MAKCNLCTLNKDLVKKSQIYPDFLNKDLFNKYHKLIKVSTDEIIKNNPKISRPSTGIYERKPNFKKD